MAQLIDGKAISAQIKEEVKEKVAALKEQGCEVTLAVIQVGADPASSVYVRNKKKACEYVGVRSLAYELPEETTEEKLLETIRQLYTDRQKYTNAMAGNGQVDSISKITDLIEECARA